MNQSGCRLHQAMRLYQLIGDIDDCYITAVVDAPKLKGKISWFKVVAVAACIALVVCGSYGLFQWVNNPKLVYGSANTVYIHKDESTQVGHGMGYSISEMAARADVIVEAEVIQNDYTDKSRYPEKNFVFYAQLSVRDVLKGNVKQGDVLYVEDAAEGYFSMESPNVLHSISCDGPLLEKGNRVVVFLIQYESGRNEITKDNKEIRYYTALGEEGRFFFDSDGKYHNGPTYIDQWETLCLSQAVYLKDYEPKTLEEIKELIKE